ncbi:MAG: hypothetical protein ABW042_01305, partial [Phenylobacterium sp.]
SSARRRREPGGASAASWSSWRTRAIPYWQLLVVVFEAVGPPEAPPLAVPEAGVPAATSGNR